MRFRSGLTVGLLLLLLSCQPSVKEAVVFSSDLTPFLQPYEWVSGREARETVDYWSGRINTDTSGLGDLTPLANAYTHLFESTGKYNYLRSAEQLLSRACSIAASNKDAYARNLAQNYISQHRFADAERLLDSIYNGPNNRRETELMRFDVYLERGRTDSAYANLSRAKDLNDLNYLLRLARWLDHEGDLDAAIERMEEVKAKVDSRNLTWLKAWAYPNLADFYGHAGRIQDSYALYLKTLELEPDNSHAWQGIAWLAYSADNNTDLALNILDSLELSYHSPAMTLMRLDMAGYMNDPERQEIWTQVFLDESRRALNGDLYRIDRAYTIMEADPGEALLLAEREWDNRRTAATAVLLASAYLANGRSKEAMALVETYRYTSEEPLVLFRMAVCYAQLSMDDEVIGIQQQLSEAGYELGPYKYARLMSL